MTPQRRPPTDSDRHDAALIWDYHQMSHQLHRCSAAICLGGPDPGLPALAADLYHRGLFPVIVISGANSPDTTSWYPGGEAAGIRAGLLDLGVPPEVVLLEPNATNTGQNIELSRKVFADAGVEVASLMLICMPYMQRRAYATARRAWPEADVICASEAIGFDTYAERIGDPALALDMIIGDLQRIMRYPSKGFAIEQHVPDDVLAAYHRLVDAGYTSRLATE